MTEPTKANEGTGECACAFLDHKHGEQLGLGCLCCDMNADKEECLALATKLQSRVRELEQELAEVKRGSID